MFLALKQDVPEGQAVPLPHFKNNVNLVNDGQVRLMSNVCPHQRSRIAKCATSSLKCPYHGFEFNLSGSGINNSYTLAQLEWFATQTILFDRPVKSFPIDTSFMKLREYRVDFVKASVDVIMDVFLDIDHIPVAHPKVYDQVGITNIDDLNWETFEEGSIQYVPAQDSSHMIDADKTYNLGACWLAVYPGTMIEWQPGALFVTVAVNGATSGCDVHVYKYFDTRYWDESYQLNSDVWELAWQQDRELAENITGIECTNIDGLKTHHRRWLQHDH